MLFKALGLHWIAWNPWFWKRRRRCGSCSSTDNPISPELLLLLLLLPRLNWGGRMRIAATRFAWPPEDLDSSAIPASSGAVQERRSGGESETRRDDIGYWKDVVDEKIEERVAGIRGSGDLVALGFGLNHMATSQPRFGVDRSRSSQLSLPPIA
jgi:hypothetical protein